MKHLYLNLKRFDVPVEFGGINRLAPVESWGEYIVRNTQDALAQYDPAAVEFVQFLPEAHLINAIRAKKQTGNLQIGSQSVYGINTKAGVNFGALTANRPASIVKAIGCSYTMVGHCEERADKAGILSLAGQYDPNIINRIMNQEIKAAIDQGLKVLYCIGEKSEELASWEDVLGNQLKIGLEGVDKSNVVIGYEPIWSIGPGKTPADSAYITKIAKFIKATTGGIDVVYGGGLKLSNANMLAQIAEMDGGLIALTRFEGEIGFYPDEYLEIIRAYLA